MCEHEAHFDWAGAMAQMPEFGVLFSSILALF
jgi:hypothetical protein